MKLRMRFVSHVIAVLTATAVLTSCQRPSSPQTLRIAILTWPGYVFAAVGQQQGFFGDLKIEHIILDDNDARYPAFQSGQFDMMFSSSTDTVFEDAQGILSGAKIVGLTDVSLGGDGMIARAGIKSVEQLKGKRVAYVRCAPEFILLIKALEKVGLSLQDVTAVPIEDPSMAAQSLLSGQLDAAMSWEPFLSQMERAGRGKILVTSRDYPGLVQDVIVAHPKLLARPEVLETFLRGWLKSAEFCRAHPDVAQPIIAKVLQMRVDDLRAIWSVCLPGTADVQREYLTGSPSKLEQSVRGAGEIYVQQKIIPRATPTSELIDTRIMRTLLNQNNNSLN